LRILQKMGYRPDLAATGLEALDQRPYDVVLMDVHIPDLDGLEATRRLCAERPTSRPRIIAMTANAMQGDREQCLAAGMDDYIAKPIKPEELRATISRWGATIRNGSPEANPAGTRALKRAPRPVDYPAG